MNRNKILNETLNYILEHYSEDISVGHVAAHFHFSKYYFCRMFKESTGESIYAFIKRLKLDQSAVDIKLGGKKKRITDIGLDYGYSSSNYSSAFKEHHHISPVDFKKSVEVSRVWNPFYPQEIEPFCEFQEYDNRIEIQECEDVVVLYERFLGNYIELKEKWFNFLKRHEGIIADHTLLIEKYYNDPMITQLNQCLCDLCITVDSFSETDSVTTIKGGRFAVYHYQGKIQDIFRALQGLYTVWLPNSRYQMKERYGLNVYRSIEESAEHVTMDFYIPIQ